MTEKIYLVRHEIVVARLALEECRKADGREIDQFDGVVRIYLVRMNAGEVMVTRSFSRRRSRTA